MRPRGQYFGRVDLIKIHNYLLPHRQNDINLEARVYRMTHGIMCVTITRNSCVTIDILERILIGNARVGYIDQLLHAGFWLFVSGL